MLPIFPVTRDWPLHDVAGTRRLEMQAMAALPPHALMARAGAAVARLSLALAPHARTIRVVVGTGNNGGDGLVAARLLRAAGREVHVSLFGDTTRLPADAADALAQAIAEGVPVAINPASFIELGDDRGDADLWLDALLGIGSRGAPREPIAGVIASLGAKPRRVLSIDVPSGLDADTGDAPGAVVRAEHTLSLLHLKPGLFTAAGRDHAGRVWLDDLGIDPSTSPAPAAWLSGPPLREARSHAQHKGSFGDVAVIGGAPGMQGAALLAARAALAAGAGRVYLSPLDVDAATLDRWRPELMFRPRWWTGADDALVGTTVVCGCGGGDAVAPALPRLLTLVPRLVLDADALNAIAADPSLQAALIERAARALSTVLTPHPLEAARLLGSTTQAVQRDRLRAARTLADRFGSVVVLKGSGSVVAAPAERPWINPTGNAALATAGTGDVLAGWIGGRWAPSRHALETARTAVFTHGLAADRSAHAPLRAGDLIEAMYAALR